MKKYAKSLLAFLSVSLAFAFSSVAFSSLLIRNLGWIIGVFLSDESGGGYDFALIFEQTKNARLSFSFIIPFILGALFYLAVKFVFANLCSVGLRYTLSVFLCCFLLLVSLAVSLLLTRVNGIRFCDLLYKLIPLIDKL